MGAVCNGSAEQTAELLHFIGSFIRKTGHLSDKQHEKEKNCYDNHARREQQKMTLADLRQVAYIQGSMEENRNKMSGLYQQTGEIYRQLDALSGMTQVRRSLERIMEEVESEKKALDDMQRCLGQSLRVYSGYETNIAEFAEEKAAYGKINGDSGNIGVVEIPQRILDLL